MSPEQKLLFIQCVLAMAWIDGDFHDAERDYLSKLLAAVELDDQTQPQVQRWLDEAPPDPDWAVVQAQPELGELILRQALELSMLDMSVTAREMSFLQTLRAKLGLEEMAFYKLQHEVEQQLAKRLNSAR